MLNSTEKPSVVDPPRIGKVADLEELCAHSRLCRHTGLLDWRNAPRYRDIKHRIVSSWLRVQLKKKKKTTVKM